MIPAKPPVTHQGTCVAIGSRAILIEGPSGTGKSALALELIDRGARLIGDDSVLLETRDDALVARPHPHTRGLIEVRNLGLVTLPVCDEARVALLVRLDENAPRFIETAQSAERAGCAVPMVRLWPAATPLALKAELALRKYGLPSGERCTG